MQTTIDIDLILGQASRTEVEILRKTTMDRMAFLGFKQIKSSPPSFTYRNLKHNLALMHFVANNFSKKLKDFKGSTRFYIDTFFTAEKGKTTISLCSFPSEGVAFYGVTSEYGLTAYIADFADALEAYDRVSKMGPAGTNLLM